MPAPICYAHRILKVMSKARRYGETHALGPDAKSQVTIRYEAGKPVEAAQIVVSTRQIYEKLSSDDIRAIVEPYVREALPEGWVSKQTVWPVNPTGKFVIGGPDGDCGLTGRKTIVDT
jgi:S-adenosylmethionine synthetase